MAKVVEIIATIAMLFLIFGGMGSQAKLNFKNKSTRGVSLQMYLCGFMVACSWAVFGFLVNAYLMCSIQILAAVMNCVVLYQFWLYRRAPSSPPQSGEDNNVDSLDRWSDEGGR